MSPILVRPVREQLEHDRIIRLLQAKYKRKSEVAINPGNEQSAPVGGTAPVVPGSRAASSERGRKLLGVVEVETAESVNHLEAMSQWVAFSKLRVPFHLYVPVSMMDVARRLCEDMQIPVAEILGVSDRWAISSASRSCSVQRSLEVTRPGPPRSPVQRPRLRAAAANGQARARDGGAAPRQKTAAKKTARPRRPSRAGA